ncbi:MAG: cation diffusion facilitator family transporter [Chthoniobacterales bacterium]
MAHDHHSQRSDVSSRTMGAAVLLTLAFVIGETVAARFAHSLALLSDAGHNFADALALAFSWYAIWISRREATTGMTFGYHRVSVLAALVNAGSLVVIAVLIIWEAIERLQSPAPVNGGLMIGVAAAAIPLNLLISSWLRRGRHDMNVRSAYLHMVGDAVSALGVVIAGLIIAWTGWAAADPLVSFLIAAFILWTSWGTLKETINALLEGTPEGLDLEKVVACIKKVDGVLDVHDLHVWTVGSGLIASSCHVLVEEQSASNCEAVLKSVAHELEHDYGINHSTIQVEVEGCETTHALCSQQPVKS